MISSDKKEELSKIKVSIIMAAYNAESTIMESVLSVFDQSHSCWELIIVNDGSTDGTLKIISNFNDSRVVIINQKNEGVSGARNKGLEIMTGLFFCFLDADDLLTSRSLESRLKVFSTNENVAFVDGVIENRDLQSNKLLNMFIPTFKGNPYKELLLLNDSCFCGQTWMIKKDLNRTYKFNTDQTHGEDLSLFMELSRNGEMYDYTKETILIYRRHRHSAMANLGGLESFYLSHLAMCSSLVSKNDLSHLDYKRIKNKVGRIMYRSYLKNFQIRKALFWWTKKVRG